MGGWDQNGPQGDWLGGGVWSGFTWLRIGSVGGLLWMRWWTFGFWRHRVSWKSGVEKMNIKCILSWRAGLINKINNLDTSYRSCLQDLRHISQSCDGVNTLLGAVVYKRCLLITQRTTPLIHNDLLASRNVYIGTSSERYCDVTSSVCRKHSCHKPPETSTARTL
jgi:hypothetical protein